VPFLAVGFLWIQAVRRRRRWAAESERHRTDA
jgi:hypothetical protein